MNANAKQRGRGMKLLNEYALSLGDLYEAPKAVIAAVAVSMLTCGGDQLDQCRELFAREWLILHQNGIVPQKPPADALRLAAEAEAKDVASAE